MSVSIVDAIEHMTPAQVLRTLGFEPHPIGPILEGVYYVGPPEIPGLSAKEIARWSVYWSWVMLHDLDAAPQRLLNTNGTRSGIKPAITTTFAEYCAARGVCRCLHGDVAHGDGDCQGECDVCDCSSYLPLDKPPSKAIVYLTSGSHSLAERADATEQLREAERLRADADRKLRNVTSQAEQTAQERTAALQRQAQERLQQAMDLEHRAAEAEHRTQIALLNLQAAERKAAEEHARRAALIDAARTGNRTKTLDMGE